MRDLQRLPDPFQRIGLLHILQRITAVRLLQLFAQHRRRHIARADTVDPYPRRQIQGQCFRKRYDSALGRAVPASEAMFTMLAPSAASRGSKVCVKKIVPLTLVSMIEKKSYSVTFSKRRS